MKRLILGVTFALAAASPVFAADPIRFHDSGFRVDRILRGRERRVWWRQIRIPALLRRRRGRHHRRLGRYHVQRLLRRRASRVQLAAGPEVADRRGERHFLRQRSGENWGSTRPISPAVGNISASAGSEVKWFGTGRARVGFLPTSRTSLAYATGGVAFGEVKPLSYKINISEDGDPLFNRKRFQLRHQASAWRLRSPEHHLRASNIAITDHLSFKTDLLRRLSVQAARSTMRPSFSAPRRDNLISRQIGPRISTRSAGGAELPLLTRGPRFPDISPSGSPEVFSPPGRLPSPAGFAFAADVVPRTDAVRAFIAGERLR